MDEMGSPTSSFLLNQINEERMELHRQGSRDYGELYEECLSCLVGEEAGWEMIGTMSRVEELSCENNKRLKKADRRKVRSALRLASSSISDHIPPTRSVTVNSTRFVVEGWEGVKVFEFFRSVLQEGFLTILICNSTFHDILNLLTGFFLPFPSHHSISLLLVIHVICGVDVRGKLSQGVRPQEEVYLVKWCHKYE